jgi:tetratricopeptide (TPR) repeat protein
MIHFPMFFLLFSLTTNEPAWQVHAQAGEWPQAIEEIKKAMETSPEQEKVNLHLCLSQYYLKDQKEEEAFRTFLLALKEAPKQEYQAQAEEEEVYSKALKIYLEESTRPPFEIAKELQTLLQPIVEAHPDWAKVRLILAQACANMHSYDTFFTHFYEGYSKNSDCFLSHRTLAILHIKLFEKAKTPEEKEAEKEEVQICLQNALKLYSEDSTLYKLMIFFAPTQKKKDITSKTLENIISGTCVIPRKDIPFFVHEALEVKEKELARRFLDKAAGWYQYSRMVQELRKAIDDKNEDS